MAVPAAARAQGGLLDPTTEYQMITGPWVDNRHGQPQAIVLWQGPLGWNQPRTPAERQRSDSIFRWTRLHAEESHQSMGGSGLWYVLVDDDHSAVTVEGKRFSLTPGDSTLVIMVTVPPNDLPRAVTTAKIASSDVPDDFWVKQWQSGDTSFIVRPDFRKQQSMLRSALVRSPAVAAFLKSSSIAVGSSPVRSADVLVPVQGNANEAASLLAFHPDLPAVDGPFECTGTRQAGASGMDRELLGAKAVSISAAFPGRAETRATVVVIIDSAGNIIRYAERRGPPIHPVVPKGSVPTAAEVVAAASAVRSTMMTLDYRTGGAIVENRGGGRPDEVVFGPVGVVDSMDKFGKPAERAARVVAQCKDRR